MQLILHRYRLSHYEKYVVVVNPGRPPCRAGPHTEGVLRLALRERTRERRQIRSFQIDIRRRDGETIHCSENEGDKELKWEEFEMSLK